MWWYGCIFSEWLFCKNRINNQEICFIMPVIHKKDLHSRISHDILHHTHVLGCVYDVRLKLPQDAAE
jgi:hypothetical protein